MQDFRNLRVWQRSHELTLAVFKVTALLPRDERYLLAGQIRRAAASVPANIVEGTAGRSDRDTARYLGIAAGSAAELEYHLILLGDLELLKRDDIDELLRKTASIRRMLNVFARRRRERKLTPANGQLPMANGQRPGRGCVSRI